VHPNKFLKKSTKKKFMEKTFPIPITSICAHPIEHDIISLGFIDGRISCFEFDSELLLLKKLWTNKLKRSIRALEFSTCGTLLYTISANRAAAVFDAVTGKRLRCIKKCHQKVPNTLCILPSSISNQLVASGAEDGEIKTWDFRMECPTVSIFHDQDDVINDFSLYKNSLLSVSDDSTLAAYDLRKNQLRVKSETMHSELLSMAITDKFTYAGASDSHIEVFNNGEYGNIRERIETQLVLGVGSLVALRPNLLLAGGPMDDRINLIHVNPNKILKSLESDGGIDLMMLTKDKDLSTIISVGSDFSKLKFTDVYQLIEDIPVLTAQDMHKFKKKNNHLYKSICEENNFYSDLFSDDKIQTDSD